MKLENIRLDYGNFSALRNINLEITYSEIRAVSGEHGPGKGNLPA